MNREQPRFRPRKLAAFAEPEIIGSPAHERAVMLELASTLDEWPARNIVFRNRLDFVAREIVRLASIPSAAEPAERAR